MSEDKDLILWHYTGIDGAIHILKDGVIKGKKLSAFNDTDPFEYISGLVVMYDYNLLRERLLSIDGIKTSMDRIYAFCTTDKENDFLRFANDETVKVSLGFSKKTSLTQNVTQFFLVSFIIRKSF